MGGGGSEGGRREQEMEGRREGEKKKGEELANYYFLSLSLIQFPMKRSSKAVCGRLQRESVQLDCGREFR